MSELQHQNSFLGSVREQFPELETLEARILYIISKKPREGASFKDIKGRLEPTSSVFGNKKGGFYAVIADHLRRLRSKNLIREKYKKDDQHFMYYQIRYYPTLRAVLYTHHS